ncbi:hypothetical protein [Sphingomonas dokdonensis]|uniref:Uncharacterized protein n=1 Tax=Sphingomonas dokdonensis TaxID=344880 RepID=A0A245ZHN8_9SPHN|nr:hypothetical protein [Sphingomonas dokdonensis]OWK29240.1 hypothetical protein SPDO_22210 [Sphingomonas dokdonensis]
MTYASWEPRHRCTTIQPGKIDLFVVTLVDGRRAALDPITDYDAALARARAFHRDHPCQVKVLPLTGTEARVMLGITVPDHPQPMDAADLRLVRDTLTDVVRNTGDHDARADALALLTDMGVVRA